MAKVELDEVERYLVERMVEKGDLIEATPKHVRIRQIFAELRAREEAKEQAEIQAEIAHKEEDREEAKKGG